MAALQSRQDLQAHIRQELGEPVIRLNVAPVQVDNAIDDALQFWTEYHVDGQERSYIRHQITQTDLDNGYITVPDNVFAVMKVIDMNTFGGSSSDTLFDFRYQFMVDTIWQLRSYGDISGFFIAKQYMADISNVINPEPGFRFRQLTNRVYVEDLLPSLTAVGRYVILEVHCFLDPLVYSRVWNDRYLKKLAAAYLKKQWGHNMKKFSGVTLPSGITMNGSEIYADALQEIDQLETAIMDNQFPLGLVVA